MTCRSRLEAALGEFASPGGALVSAPLKGGFRDRGVQRCHIIYIPIKLSSMYSYHGSVQESTGASTENPLCVGVVHDQASRGDEAFV